MRQRVATYMFASSRSPKAGVFLLMNDQAQHRPANRTLGVSVGLLQGPALGGANNGCRFANPQNRARSSAGRFPTSTNHALRAPPTSAIEVSVWCVGKPCHTQTIRGRYNGSERVQGERCLVQREREVASARRSTADLGQGCTQQCDAATTDQLA